MKKWIFVLVGAMLVAGGVIGFMLANEQEKEREGMGMEECVEMVKRLQTGDAAERQEVLSELKGSEDWTLLDEIGDPEVDEKEEDMSLGLNAMAYEVASSNLGDYGNPQGVFVDGRDPDYKVCFIEKCLAAGQEVVYEMEERTSGESLAVVEMADGDLDVWLYGVQIEPRERVFSGESRGENVTLRVRNRRGNAVSFVVINEH